MFLDDIRAYIDLKVKAVDPTLSFFDDPFGDNDIENVLADKSYKFWFTTTAPSKTGNIYTEDMSCSIEIYGARQRDLTSNFDDVFCKAHQIKDELIAPESVKNSSAFTDILIDLIEPDPLPTDDKTVKVRLDLRIRRDLSFI